MVDMLKILQKRKLYSYTPRVVKIIKEIEQRIEGRGAKGIMVFILHSNVTASMTIF